jgi:hypothetical protein
LGFENDIARMIPFLTYPLALIALAALPALAAIYLLRNRFRRRQVSSLMLWRFRVQSKEGGAKVNRLQLPLIFFLELLALLLLVTAATGPHWKLAQASRPLVVVLDDSFSMRGVADGSSSRERAREFLQKMFRFQAPPSTRLVLAGSQSRLLGGAVRNWTEVEKLLSEWHCWAPDASIGQAITLASEIGKQEANILVLTDQTPPETKVTNERLQWRGFGKPADNLAIVNASRTAHGEEDRCLLELANFSKVSRATTLQVQTGSNAIQQMQVSLAPREQQRLVFNIARSETLLQVRLDPDGLDIDNAVQLLPPDRKKIRVRVAVSNSELGELVERTLDATGLRAAISDSPELVIHHSSVSPGSNAWSLNWQIGAEPQAFVGPFVIDGSHPLAQGISLQGVVWAASVVTNSSDDIPVILAGNVPLLSVREDLSGRRFLTLNFKPELSTLQRSPDWPALLWNILDWRANQMPGLLENNVRLGAEVILKTSGEAVTVTAPDGTERTFPQTSQQIALETSQPGLYSVGWGGNTNAFSVNALAADESDLQKSVSGEWGAWKTDLSRRYEQSPMAWIFALCALGLLSLHLCLLGTGRGGS